MKDELEKQKIENNEALDEEYQYLESECQECKGFGIINEQDGDNLIERKCLCQLEKGEDNFNQEIL